MRLLILAPLLAACAFASGCQGPVVPQASADPAATEIARRTPPALKLTAITGVVMGPVGRILSGNAAGIVSANAGSYRLLAIEEAPLADVEVQLVDADGEAVAGIAPALTDAEGRYRIERVPVGHTVILQARAQAVGSDRPALLRTLVRTAEEGSEADLSAATTLVTAALVDEKRPSLGAFDPQSFAAMARATAKDLRPQDLPDFTVPSAVKARIEALAEARQALKDSLTEARTELQQVPEAVADLKEQLRQRDALDHQPPAPRPHQDEEATAAVPGDRPDRPSPPPRPERPVPPKG